MPIHDQLLGCLLASLASVGCFAHPKPGAHADVRFTIEPRAVRAELLMNLSFVDGLIQTRRQARDDILPEEESDLHAALLEYFGGAPAGPSPRSLDRANILNIDGVPVPPHELLYRIVRPEPETRPGFVQSPMALIPQVHLVLLYPCAQRPRQVSIAWGTFPRDFLDQQQQVPPPVQIESVLIAEGEIRLITFTKSEPEYIWHTSDAPVGPHVPPILPTTVPVRTVPLLSLALPLAWACWRALHLPGSRRAWAAAIIPVSLLSAAAWNTARVPLPTLPWSSSPSLKDDELLRVFSLLHANIYRAFDYTDPGEIYDTLAASVDGPLLDAIYTQVYRSLIMQEEGGALSRVQAVRTLEQRVRRPRSTSPTAECIVDARWQVDGMVYHWGHSHTRRSEFRAEYAIARLPDGWKIVACTPIEQFRVPMEGDPAPLPPPPTPKEHEWRPTR